MSGNLNNHLWGGQVTESRFERKHHCTGIAFHEHGAKLQPPPLWAILPHFNCSWNATAPELRWADMKRRLHSPLYESFLREAGGTPSTWSPPGQPVELARAINECTREHFKRNWTCCRLWKFVYFLFLLYFSFLHEFKLSMFHYYFATMRFLVTRKNIFNEGRHMFFFDHFQKS